MTWRVPYSTWQDSSFHGFLEGSDQISFRFSQSVSVSAQSWIKLEQNFKAIMIVNLWESLRSSYLKKKKKKEISHWKLHFCELNLIFLGKKNINWKSLIYPRSTKSSSLVRRVQLTEKAAAALPLVMWNYNVIFKIYRCKFLLLLLLFNNLAWFSFRNL